MVAPFLNCPYSVCPFQMLWNCLPCTAFWGEFRILSTVHMGIMLILWSNFRSLYFSWKSHVQRRWQSYVSVHPRPTSGSWVHSQETRNTRLTWTQIWTSRRTQASPQERGEEKEKGSAAGTRIQRCFSRWWSFLFWKGKEKFPCPNKLRILWGVLVLLNCMPIHARLDCFSSPLFCGDSIIMEAWKPARWKTAKIHRNEHTPELLLVATVFK